MAKRKPRGASSADEAALLAAARDSRDGTARGAYADWLDERGRAVEAAEWRATTAPTRLVYRLRHRPTGAVYEARTSHRAFKSFVVPSGSLVSAAGVPSVVLPRQVVYGLSHSAPEYWRARCPKGLWDSTDAQRTVPLADLEVVVERWAIAEVLVQPLADALARPVRDLPDVPVALPPVV